MKGLKMYNSIHQLKEKGFRKAAVAKELSINRRTVDKYWNMTIDCYQKQLENTRRESALMAYRERILEWMQDYSSISAAQICDWLKEHYADSFSERTVSRFVKELRKEYGITKHKEPRSFECVPELPMGQQIQVDFGQLPLRNTSGGWTKIYTIAFVLSHSRYKYAEVQSRPFKAPDLIASCYRCFKYLGGMPREMVFDQDAIVCVSENAGDIIYTYEFEKFRQNAKMSIYMCHGADPQSKGKVESAVKYVKNNFLEHRLYVDDESLNKGCLAWLERTANVKLHGTTKRIPAEVFAEEQKHLREFVEFSSLPTNKVLRTVRKDNTIIYGSNRYSLPLGTYGTHAEVLINPQDGILYILTVNNEPICEHLISGSRGVLVQNTNHRRDRTKVLDALQEGLDEKFEHKATAFLQAVRTTKSRYARDQFAILHGLLDKYSLDDVLKGVCYCEKGSLYSANIVREYLEHKQIPPEPLLLPPTDIVPLADAKYHVTTEKRSLDVYAKVGGC